MWTLILEEYIQYFPNTYLPCSCAYVHKAFEVPLTLSSVQVESMGALASSWQVRSKYALGWTSHRGIVGDGGRRDWSEAQDRSSSTLFRSSWSKLKERLEVRGSIDPPTALSNAITEKPNVFTSVMELLNNCTCEEKC